jgi:hypothetical protein
MKTGVLRMLHRFGVVERFSSPAARRPGAASCQAATMLTRNPVITETGTGSMTGYLQVVARMGGFACGARPPVLLARNRSWRDCHASSMVR